MDAIKTTSGTYLKTIQILHIAIVIGIFGFAVISIIIQSQGFQKVDQETEMVLMVIVPIFALIGIIGSNFIFKKRLVPIRSMSSLKDKLIDFRTALIIKFVILDAPAFFAVIAFLLTGNYFYLGITAALVVTFAIYFPTKSKLINDLRLSRQEVDQLSDPNAEIN